MKSIKTIAELRATIASWREAGDSIALVPTMGNLHNGHLSLVKLAGEHAEHVIVSVFVNPTQFGPSEDFAKYPRTPDMDSRRLLRAKVDILFEPSVAEMYPSGTEGSTRVQVPEISNQLCGTSRPGHFDGVASVVCRLLHICSPNIAVFGQKDYQQLVILRRMATDLHMPIKLLAGQTSRSKNGLALSSRNSFLDEGQQETATVIYTALKKARQSLADGRRDFDAITEEGRKQIAAAGLEPEYFEIRRAADLSVPVPSNVRLVILAAARFSGVRLIDNVLVELTP